MTKTIREIAEYLGGTVFGDDQVAITAVAAIEEAQAGELTFLANPKYRVHAQQTKASAVLVAPGIEIPGRTVIQVQNPYLAFAQVLTMFATKRHPPVGVHPTCVCGEGTTLGAQCAVGAHVTIGNQVQIGDRTIIYPGVVIGDAVTIGADTLIYPNVSILQDVVIGNRVIIHSGTVIGSDGFGFAPDGETVYKIPQVGTVVIADDVEIGANVTIDRAAMGQTRIERGVKIDNLVQIAHNVVIGENSIIVAQVGISGSTKVGKHVTLAGQVGLVGHIQIGDQVKIGAKSGVTKSIPEKTIFSGSPAVEHNVWRKSQVALLRLPEALKTIRALEQRIQELEARLAPLAE
jgi:UDP-3-O-[3-hydroxymyristoyl] glucosamine N-acyltransferase